MRKALIFGALAALLIGAPLVSKLTRGENAKRVELATVEARAVQSSILASGTLAYREEVQLRSEVIAKVVDLTVEEADPVKHGDLIIKLDPDAFEAQVAQQEANVRLQRIAIERQRIAIENLERSFSRKEGLFAKKLIDDDAFEAARNELALARVDLRSREEALTQASATLAQARDQLTKTEIRSPIDGIVIQVDVKVGETVIAGTTNIPGSTLVVIADPSEMLVEVQVDEADIAQVAVGQRADIFAAAFPDTALVARVESIATRARRDAGQQGLSFLVKLLLENPDAVAVRPGMSARADIFTETSADALAVPVQAVLYDEEAEAGENQDDDRPAQNEQPYVMVVENGVAKRRDVKLGISSDSDQEVLEGLDEGESIVSGPYRVLRHLKDGETVEEANDDEESDGE